MPLTIATAVEIADFLLQGRPVWGSLHTASPTPSGAVSHELSGDGTGYARVDMTGLLSPANISTGLVILSGVINIGPALVDWPMITHFALMRGAVGEEMIAFTALDEAETVNAESQFQRVPGQLTFRLI